MNASIDHMVNCVWERFNNIINGTTNNTHVPLYFCENCPLFDGYYSLEEIKCCLTMDQLFKMKEAHNDPLNVLFGDFTKENIRNDQ
jgi:hypothetical protein